MVLPETAALIGACGHQVAAEDKWIFNALKNCSKDATCAHSHTITSTVYFARVFLDPPQVPHKPPRE